jgi:hypothetical protein
MRMGMPLAVHLGTLLIRAEHARAFEAGTFHLILYSSGPTLFVEFTPA